MCSNKGNTLEIICCIKYNFFVIMMFDIYNWMIQELYIFSSNFTRFTFKTENFFLLLLLMIMKKRKKEKKKKRNRYNVYIWVYCQPSLVIVNLDRQGLQGSLLSHGLGYVDRLHVCYYLKLPAFKLAFKLVFKTPWSVLSK
jgi:hypothetical protein